MRFIVYRSEHFVKIKVSEKYDYIGNICGVSPQKNKTTKKKTMVQRFKPLYEEYCV